MEEGKYTFEREMTDEEAANTILRLADARPVVRVSTNDLQAYVAPLPGEIMDELGIAARAVRFERNDRNPMHVHVIKEGE